jgi:hypothetical protein
MTTDADSLYEVNYNGWIMRGYAKNERQAKYRAWRHFSATYPVKFRDFVYSARPAIASPYEHRGGTLWKEDAE